VNTQELLAIPLDGTHLIEASAGTGKTYTLTSLYLRYLLEQELEVNQILVVTYTVPATDELRERIRSRIHAALGALSTGACGDEYLKGLAASQENPARAVERLQEALHRFDEAAIFTIHGFCQRMLHEMAFESGSPFASELITDQSEIQLNVIDDFFRGCVLPDAVPEFVSYLRRKRVTPETLLNLVRKVPLHARIIPEGKAPEIEPARSLYQEQFKRVEHCWNKEREQILQLLLLGGNLKRSLYKPESLPIWGRCMDDFISSQGRELPVDPFIERFSTSKIGTFVKKGFLAPEHPFFSLCEELLQRSRALVEAMDEKIIWLKREVFRFLDAELPRRKERNSLIHFDDMLMRMRDALRSEEGSTLAHAIREHLKAALIDEFQDTDPIQYEIFSTVFPEGPLFMIGDPKQAIYSFRGADIFTYLSASQSVPRALRHTLRESYRSEPGLIEAINHLFSSSQEPFVFRGIGFEPAIPAAVHDRALFSDGKDAHVVLWFFGSDNDRPIPKFQAEERITGAVVNEISRLLTGASRGEVRIGDQRIKPSDIAVLVRENRQARMIRDALRSHAIPCVVLSDENVFDSPETLDMEMVLKAMAEPFSEGLIRTALASRILGFTAREIDDLLDDESSWETWIITFRACHDLWRSQGFIAMFRRFISQINLRERLLSQHRGERLLTNILHLSEVLNQAERQRHLGMRQLVKWFSLQCDPSMRREEEHQLRLETDDDAVKVLTIHKSKGLEFPVVFCPFSWSGSTTDDAVFLFHDPDRGFMPTIDLGSLEQDAHRTYAETEALAENMRLLYVALTRAKHRCYLAWGTFNQAETSALSHLLHAPRAPGTSAGIQALKGMRIDQGAMLQDLLSIIAQGQPELCLEEPPSGAPQRFHGETLKTESLSARRFRGEIDRSWGIASFTSLVSRQALSLEEVADRDTLTFVPSTAETARSEPEKLDAYSIPRGARTGTLLHKIFELIDFQADDRSIRLSIEQVMETFGFDEKWGDTIFTVVTNVLTTDLGNFRLIDISRDSRLTELEFYLPLKNMTPMALRDVFRDGGARLMDVTEMLGRLRFDPVQGYLRGFMDLVFRHGGRYYLLDWKSNYLGSDRESYGRDALQAVMHRDYYVLQYHLYTLALDQYLRRTMTGYSYQEHFAGVYYVFLRGVDPNAGADYGIVSARPDEASISRLREGLIDWPQSSVRGDLSG